MPGPDLEIRGRGTVIQALRLGGGLGLQKFLFRLFGPKFVLKIKGTARAPPLDHHWLHIGYLKCQHNTILCRYPGTGSRAPSVDSPWYLQCHFRHERDHADQLPDDERCATRLSSSAAKQRIPRQTFGVCDHARDRGCHLKMRLSTQRISFQYQDFQRCFLSLFQKGIFCHWKAL